MIPRSRSVPATFALLAALACAPLAHADEVLATEGKGRLTKRADGQRVMYLAGTPYEMGFQHGRLLGEEVRRNIGRIYDNPGELGKSLEFQVYKLARPLMYARLRTHVPARFVEEMRGLAAGAGATYAQVEAVNLFPEAFHCSGIALTGKATRDASLYHVRILDYFTKLGLQDTALVIDQSPDGHHRWLNVGFAGFIGSVTGMNAQGISVGEMGGKGLLYWNGLAMPLLVRDALERASTLDQACEIFQSTPRTCEYYYVIGDGKTDDARGVWATPDRIEFMKPGESFGFCEYDRPGKGAEGDKVFLRNVKVEQRTYGISLKSGDGKTETYVATPPEGALVMTGFDRYCHFADRLQPVYGKVDEKALMEMVKRPVSMGSNLHNAIFHPKTRRVWVAVAKLDGSPACDQEYHEYSLTDAAPAAPPPPSR